MEKKVTLLYVDDEEINLFIFEKTFQSSYNLVTAISGEEGLEKLRAHANDIIVVISDMKMPGMDGVTFIRKAKALYSNIAYYILTAFAFNEDIDKALEEKIINRFFEKPVNFEIIKSEIDKVEAQLL
jgi:response regulator RpfG family c-di-GMP phosphodiesterase